jgi:diguanylate cyclase (GGDEF)-like protein
MNNPDPTVEAGEAERLAWLDEHIPGIDFRQQIGDGAHSDVYVGEARGRDVAVKVQQPMGEVSGSERWSRRFRREAALLASLSHPAVPGVYRVGTVDERAYTVMEYIDGESLAGMLDGRGMAEDQVIRWSSRLLEILARIHRRGLIHRDLKPANILFDSRGRLRLIDFGLAGRRHELHEHAEAPRAVGTLQYSAPEQLGAIDALTDARSDLYALGILMYEALTGAPPFEDGSYKELVRQHGGVEPPPLDEFDGISSKTGRFVERLLAKDPDDRFPSARDAARFLRVEILEAKPPASEESLQDDRLVGREEPGHRLERAWRLASGGEGRSVVVRGPAGVGKTFLVEQFLRRVPPPETTVARQKADQEGAAPLAILRRCFSDWLDDADSVRSASRRDLRDEMQRLIAQKPRSVRRLAPRELRSEVSGESEVAALEHEEFWETAADLVLEVAELLGGAILMIDDLQWLDDSSRRVLRRVVSRLESVPLLVIGTARTRDEEGSLDRIDGTPVETIVLEALDPGETSRLIARYLDVEEVDEQLADRVWKRSDGNPFLIVDRLYTMIDAGVLRPHWEAWDFDADREEELEVTDSSLSLVEARLSRLEDEQTRVLAAAAVIGHRVDIPLLVAVCDTDRSTVRATVEEAARVGMLARRGLHYEFLHDRLRESLVERLDESERRRFHLATAAGFEDDLDDIGADLYAVASHYIAGGPERRPERAFDALCRAGELALEEFAHGKAVEFLSHAAELAETHDELEFGLDRRAALGEACAHDGEVERAVAELSTVIRDTDDPFRRAELRGRLSQVHLWDTMDTEPAREQYEQALRELGEPAPSEAPVRFAVGSLWRFIAGLFIRTLGLGYGSASGRDRQRARLQSLLYRQGQQAEYWELRFGTSLLYVFRGMYPATRLGRSGELVKNYGTAGPVLAGVGLESASRWMADRAVEVARELQRPALVALARNRACWCLFESGRHIEASRSLSEFLEESAHWVESGDYTFSCSELLWNYHLRGYAERSRQWVERGIERSREQAEYGGGGPRFELGAEPLAQLGDFEAAESRLEATRQLTGAGTDMTFRSALYLQGLAAIAYFSRDWQRLDEAIDGWFSFDIDPETAPTYISAFYVYAGYGTAERIRRADDREGALRERFDELLHQLESAASGRENLQAHLHVLRSVGTALSGEEDRALDTWGEAETYALEHDNPWALFECRRRRARVLRDTGTAEIVREQAAAALQLAEQMGWEPARRHLLEEFPDLDRRSTGGSSEDPSSDGVRQRSAEAYLDAMLRVSLAASGTLEPDTQVREMLGEVVSILGVERGAVFLEPDEASGSELAVRVALDATGEVVELESFAESVVEKVCRQQESVVLRDPDEAERRGYDDVLDAGIRTVAAVPLEIRDRFVGVIYLDSRLAKRVVSSKDLVILEALASHIPVALETVRTARLEMEVESERRQREFAETLRTTLTAMTRTLDRSDILEELVDGIAEFVDFDRGWAASTQGERFESVVGEGPWENGLEESNRASLEISDLLGEVIREGESRYLQDTTSPGVRDDWAVGPQAGSWFAVPLCTREKRLGVVVLAADVAGAFGERARELVETFTSQASIALENTRLAMLDPLTGLYNRRYFNRIARREFQRFERYGTPVSALIVDLDHFKSINDTFGHPAGDEVLERVSRLCQQSVRRPDVVGRYGGEEFVVLAPATEAEPDARTLADRLREVIEGIEVDWEGETVTVTASIGLTELRGDDDSVEAMLERADRALYRAKEAGRNTVEMIR